MKQTRRWSRTSNHICPESPPLKTSKVSWHYYITSHPILGTFLPQTIQTANRPALTHSDHGRREGYTGEVQWWLPGFERPSWHKCVVQRQSNKVRAKLKCHITVGLGRPRGPSLPARPEKPPWL